MRSGQRSDWRLGPVGSWLVSLVVLAALLIWLDPASIAAEIRHLDSRWVVLALLVNVNQMVISAWRWQLTAHRLGLALPWRRALADYYLASFTNQVLPGGVLGDAWRAQRHGSRSHHPGVAWRAVIIERGSGQLTVVVVALAVLGLSPAWRPALTGLWPAAAIFAGLIGLALMIVLVLTRSRQHPESAHILKSDLFRALIARGAWVLQIPAALAIVFSYALVFSLSGWGIGVGLSLPMLLTLALPVLVAMLVPFTVAGWGFREAAAAAVWLSMGLPASQGVAVAMAYGIVVLIASLPGALVILLNPLSRKEQENLTTEARRSQRKA